MATVTVHEAKTHLSKLIARALDGEEVVIARGKNPVVKLEPLHKPTLAPRVPGSMAGRFTYAPGVFDPMTEQELVDWGL